MADVELLPLPEVPADDDVLYAWAEDYARANLAPLQAENERLRAEHDALRAEYYRVVHALQDEQARADRLAEALRGLLDVGDKFTGDPNEDAATWVAANDAARAALAQEDRND